uniref:Uncharacterized protein n=1 Tax=Arundo donax TaxID=35708 RepID=A0A0A9F9A4_ARUDO
MKLQGLVADWKWNFLRKRKHHITFLLEPGCVNIVLTGTTFQIFFPCPILTDL